MGRRLGALGIVVALCVGTNFAFTIQSTPRPAAPPEGDEFVGPFPSWLNIKTAYGAVGDGAADDTRAIQRGLDQLGGDNRAPVLYFPSGTYRITGTLTLSSRIFVSVVGEDPDRTILTWDGPTGGTMLLINGVAYSRFTRFTFNGNRRAAVAVEQSWDGSQPHFDTGNEYSDARFVDVEYGIHGGFKDRGFAETSIHRSHFVRNSKAGISLGNFNSLDIWVWQSLFEDCGIGITNEPGAGNYHVYQSIFRRSTTADLYMRNTGGFSVRDNFSTRSAAFFFSPPIGYPANIDIQGNTIVNPIDSTPIRLGNQGPALVFDNVILGPPDSPGPAVSWRSPFGSDVISLGNTFTAQDPISVSGRLVALDDRVVSRSTLTTVEPLLPPARPNLGRAVFEVPRNADGAAIQRAIDAAIERGERSVVHLPFGSYAIDQTLTIPPGDIQLVGDGMGTTLRWNRSSAGPVVRIVGPSRATLREFQIHANAIVDGIVLDRIDQRGSRVSLNGVQLSEAESHNLMIDGARNTDVQMIDVGHSMAKGSSIHMNGGQLTIFSGASSNNFLSYDVSGGARALVRDIWYEGSAAGGFAAIHGEATFTMQGARVSTQGTHPPSFDIRDLDGSVTLLTTMLDDRIMSTGNGQAANLLGLAIVRDPQSPSYFSSSAVPAPRALLVNGRQQIRPVGPLNPGSRLVADIGILNLDFMRRMLTQTRSSGGPTLNALSPEQSDVRMFRVWVTKGLSNISITGAPH